MLNGTLTILARVLPVRRGALQDLLDALERRSFPVIPDVPGLHFARMALLDCAARGRGPRESYLLLAADFAADGPRRELDARFVGALLEHLEGHRAAARVFEHLFQQCEGFPGLADRASARAFLLAHRRPYGARHVAFPYRRQTPERIHEAVHARPPPDDQVQHPLTHLVPLDVHWPGLLMLRINLFLANIRLRRSRVGLDRIRGIHFARWVIFEGAGRRHLLFLSCFDGTWDGCLGACLDDQPVRALLEQLWRSSQRFAEVRTLETFKAWILARQVPTPIFYSAHRAPPPGGADIHQALQVRAAG